MHIGSLNICSLSAELTAIECNEIVLRNKISSRLLKSECHDSEMKIFEYCLDIFGAKSGYF